MRSRRYLAGVLLSTGLASARLGRAQEAGVPPPNFARYHILREQENFSFLSPDSLRAHSQPGDFFDPLKYMPLGRGGYFLTLGADVRYQYEVIKNDFWGAAAPPDAPAVDGYLLQRHMVHTDWRLGTHLRVFVQVLNTNVAGRRAGPRPQIDRDALDLYQGFAEWSTALGSHGRAELRVGRQEFLYGSERLLSMREGPNVRQSFDAARLVLTSAAGRIDLLTGRPMQTATGAFDDRGNSQQLLWAVYAVHPLRALRAGLDLYYFGLHRRGAVYLQGTGLEQRHTLGARFWSHDWGHEKAAHPFGYNLELIGQAGHFGPGRIRAYYASAIGHYHVARWPLTPTWRLATDVISGDQDRSDPDLQAFNALFPRPFFGSAITPLGPGNLLDLHPGVELHFGATMQLLASVAWLWRQSRGDAVYGATAVPLLPSGFVPGQSEPPLPTHRYIGRQFTAEWNWQTTRHLALGFTYAWVPAGDYLRATTPGRTLTYYKPSVLFQF